MGTIKYLIMILFLMINYKPPCAYVKTKLVGLCVVD